MNDLFEIILPFFLGIIASFFAWLAVVRLVRPRIKIDNKIYRFDSIDNDGFPEYKVKVTNKSRFFAVYDVTLAARVYLYGLVKDKQDEYRMYVINPGTKSSPYISPKRKRSKQVSKNERYFTLRPPFYEEKNAKENKGKLRKLYNRYHESNQLDGIMTLKDVFRIMEDYNYKTTIEFSITATSVFSSSRAYKTEKFLITEIVSIDSYDDEDFSE